jgi:hypothetical protein
MVPSLVRKSAALLGETPEFLACGHEGRKRRVSESGLPAHRVESLDLTLALALASVPWVLRALVDIFATKVGEPRLDVAPGNDIQDAFFGRSRWLSIVPTRLVQLADVTLDGASVRIDDHNEAGLGVATPASECLQLARQLLPNPLLSGPFACRAQSIVDLTPMPSMEFEEARHERGVLEILAQNDRVDRLRTHRSHPRAIASDTFKPPARAGGS